VAHVDVFRVKENKSIKQQKMVLHFITVNWKKNRKENLENVDHR